MTRIPALGLDREKEMVHEDASIAKSQQLVLHPSR